MVGTAPGISAGAVAVGVDWASGTGSAWSVATRTGVAAAVAAARTGPVSAGDPPGAGGTPRTRTVAVLLGVGICVAATGGALGVGGTTALSGTADVPSGTAAKTSSRTVSA
ncbi:MAG TPA: hypothetical protein VKD66_00025 [Streptosporangiaceae bacterium]|nr:hypothetical protein [Streptosporangiaceae bacterium]